jgi:diguanylate cyclase (GGDEF)-like protein
VISLRLKLAAYFLVLALLPLAAAYWAFSSTARASEERRVDERLQTALRAALASLEPDLEAARRTALTVAAEPALHEALAAGDDRAVERLIAGRIALQVRGRGVLAGHAPPGAHLEVDVTDGTGSLGTVVATVPFDQAFADHLRRRSGLERTDRVVLLAGTRVAGAPVDAGSLRGGRSGQPFVVGPESAPARYRVLTARRVAGDPRLAIAVMTPQEAIDHSLATARSGLLVGVGASLLLIAIAAYVEGAWIARTLRRLVSGANAIARGRLDTRVHVRSRDELGALARAFNDMAGDLEREKLRLSRVTRGFGEALGATHDSDQLLRVVVQTAVEATNAASGAVVDGDVELVRAGSSDGPDRIAFGLESRDEHFGELVLTGERFGEDERDVAATIAAHAVIALENARLHRVVEQQARFDALTGLPNRRHCEATLEGELVRARRSDEPFAFVLADLDDFKAINDRYGHPAGDRVLLTFGEIAQATIRESDLAARWGGEEFAFLMPATDPRGAEELVERIRVAVEEHPIELEDGTMLRLTVSFGIATHPDESSSAKLIRAADAALYEAKRAGKNRVATSVRQLPQPAMAR